MGEGLLAFRKKKASSIRVGAQLVKDGRADAFVSMGNTGAVVYISRDVLGALKGVDRPALALLVPGVDGTDPAPRRRGQRQLPAAQPRPVRPHGQDLHGGRGRPEGPADRPDEHRRGEGQGQRPGQGGLRPAPGGAPALHRQRRGQGHLLRRADVIVSDGFTGNVALKVTEGVVESVLSMARHEITKNIFAKLGFLLMKRHLKKIYKKVDYSEYGGAQLLGRQRRLHHRPRPVQPERRPQRHRPGPGVRRQPGPGEDPGRDPPLRARPEGSRPHEALRRPGLHRHRAPRRASARRSPATSPRRAPRSSSSTSRRTSSRPSPRSHRRGRRPGRGPRRRRRRLGRGRPGRRRGRPPPHGRIDHLVNNAGITRDNLLMRMKEEDWDAVLPGQPQGRPSTSPRPSCGRMIAARYGRIVNIASVVGPHGQRRADQLRRLQGRASSP